MRMLREWLKAVVILVALVGSAQAQSLVLKPNMNVLRCSMPDVNYRFVGSNAPGQIFFADEPVNINLAFKRGSDRGAIDFAIEIQQITTRDPGRKIESGEGFTDTAGYAPLIGLEGKPILHRIKVFFKDEPETRVEVRDLPVPRRFGTYALILIRGNKRQFLATVCRVPKPRTYGNIENTPILGEFALFDRPELYETRAAIYNRMGVRGIRAELHWSERQDGTYEWEHLDRIFSVCEKYRIQVMVTLGSHPWHFLPFGQPTPASGWTPKTGGYGGTGDWLCDPKLYPRYARWITAFCERYWKGGNGALWGLENYNEPWEGGGISGWARDCLEYRKLQKLIAESAWKVDRRIKICAASSIMNTEDKFYSDNSNEFDRYIDVFTDHYVVPPMCYGPMVARAHGKESMETETWFVNSEYLLPQIVQFLACGQKRLAPWHPRVLFDKLPGTDDNYFIPTPLVVATAAFNYFITGKPFEKIVFHNHLPWVFQFGKDNDKDGLLVVLGQLTNIAGTDPKERLWAQVENSPGGTMIIDNGDGLLKFYDLAGNPLYVGKKKIKMPMSVLPTYIMCDKGPALAARRLKQAIIEGKRPVEILPRDFSTFLNSPDASLVVAVHNCLNRDITGKLIVTPPKEIILKTSKMGIKLTAGETKELRFPIARAEPVIAHSYPFSFRFVSKAGNADYSEVLNLTIAPKGTKTIDGNLDDWNDVPGVMMIAGVQKAEIAEMLRRPWLELKDLMPDGSFAEFKLAWDENYLYVAARVNDKTSQTESPPMTGRNEDLYFHTANSDQASPYKEFISKFPGRSFAEVPYVYRHNPEIPGTPDLPIIHFRRDRLQIALDVSDDWHDLAPTTDKVPYGFHAVPDADYEYALYPCRDGRSELWRLLAPGVPRIHDYPRQPRGKRTTGPVPNAKHVVKREGNIYIYEMAIPKEELAELKLQPGTIFGLMVRAGNSDGPNIDYGTDKAVTKINGLTLHPYWERSPNCGVRWTLVD